MSFFSLRFEETTVVFRRLSRTTKWTTKWTKNGLRWTKNDADDDSEEGFPQNEQLCPSFWYTHTQTMPIVAARKNLDDSRTCPICREIYKAPFNATCGHTFCHDCVVEHCGKFWELHHHHHHQQQQQSAVGTNAVGPAVGEKKKTTTTTTTQTNEEEKEEKEEDEVEKNGTKTTTMIQTTKDFGKLVDFSNPAPCPICNASITSLTPNVALTKVVDALARVDAMTMQITEEHSPMEPQHSKIARAEKVVSALQHMDEEQLAPIVKALVEKHARAVAEGEEKRLEILRDFFDEATRRKRMKMAEGEMEMKFLRTDIERVEKLLREELKVLKRSYTEAEGRTGGGEEEEEEEDDGEDVADMLRFVPQLPGYEGDACDEDEEFERKYHAGLSSLYTKGIKEIDGVNSSMRGREEDDDNDNDDDEEDGGGNHRIEPASIDEKMNEERLEDFAQALTDAKQKYGRVRIVAEIVKPSLSMSSSSFNNNSLMTQFGAVLNNNSNNNNNNIVNIINNNNNNNTIDTNNNNNINNENINNIDIINTSPIPPVSDIVSSIDVSMDQTMFATAGVSKRIEFYTFTDICDRTAANQNEERPRITRAQIKVKSKISCLSFSRKHVSHIAASDYEGVVTIWDAETSQSILKFEEHDKRCWTVEYCRCVDNMHLIASGSDDGAVKIWSESGISMGGGNRSVMEIQMRANVCCIAWSPTTAHDIAIGCADHKVRVYDLRRPHEPLYTLSSHKKAVSYVKYISSSELCSASTDSSVCIWDVKKTHDHNATFDPYNIYHNQQQFQGDDNGVPLPKMETNNGADGESDLVSSTRLIRTLTGHVNRKNFVGLAASSDGKSVACGSETNELFVYNKNFSAPVATVSFDTPGNDMKSSSRDHNSGNHFVSAVCWSDESTLISANSKGRIKIVSLGM